MLVQGDRGQQVNAGLAYEVFERPLFSIFLRSKHQHHCDCQARHRAACTRTALMLLLAGRRMVNVPSQAVPYGYFVTEDIQGHFGAMKSSAWAWHCMQ
jgi:hypothetical protein